MLLGSASPGSETAGIEEIEQRSRMALPLLADRNFPRQETPLLRAEREYEEAPVLERCVGQSVEPSRIRAPLPAPPGRDLGKPARQPAVKAGLRLVACRQAAGMHQRGAD
jgi:hypothetical protein